MKAGGGRSWEVFYFYGRGDESGLYVVFLFAKP